jgi:hypothetical protein
MGTSKKLLEAIDLHRRRVSQDKRQIACYDQAMQFNPLRY